MTRELQIRQRFKAVARSGRWMQFFGHPGEDLVEAAHYAREKLSEPLTSIEIIPADYPRQSDYVTQDRVYERPVARK